MTVRAATLFHIALPEDLTAAEATGEYPVSTRGATVDQIGFVHLAYEHQWRGVWARYYADRPDALLLELDVARLGAEVRDEAPAEGMELFPHLYGRLPLDAVVARHLVAS